MRCPKSKLPIGIIVFDIPELIVLVFQGLSRLFLGQAGKHVSNEEVRTLRLTSRWTSSRTTGVYEEVLYEAQEREIKRENSS